jgi:hypothetical protein
LNGKKHTELDSFISGLVSIDETALCGVGTDGNLYAYSASDMTTLRRMKIRSEGVPPPTGLPPNIFLPGSFSVIKEQCVPNQTQILSNYSNQTNTTMSHETLQEMVLWRTRLVLLGMDLFVENLADPNAAASAPGKKPAAGKKDAPPVEIKPRKFYKMRFTVFDIFSSLQQQQPSSSSHPYLKFERIHDSYLDQFTIENNNNMDYLSSEEINELLHQTILTDLSVDGRIFSIAFHENNVANPLSYQTCLCQVYDLAKPKEWITLSLSQLLNFNVRNERLPGVMEENDDAYSAHSTHGAGGGDKQRFSPRLNPAAENSPSAAAVKTANSVELTEETNPMSYKSPFLITQWKINGPPPPAPLVPVAPAGGKGKEAKDAEAIPAVPPPSITEKKLIIKKLLVLLPLDLNYDYFNDHRHNSNKTSSSTTTAPQAAAAPTPVSVPPPVAAGKDAKNSAPPTMTETAAAPVNIEDLGNASTVVPINEDRLVYYSKIHVLVIPHQFPFLLFYQMSSMKPDFSLQQFYLMNTPGAPPPVANAKDKKPAADAKKGKEGETATGAVNFPFSMNERNRWMFSSAISSWNIINGTLGRMAASNSSPSVFREYLVVGQVDGVITLWDIYKQNHLMALGHHPAAITSLVSHRTLSLSPYSNNNGEQPPIVVIAGALDGTMTLYSNKIENNHSNGAGRSNNNNNNNRMTVAASRQSLATTAPHPPGTSSVIVSSTAPDVHKGIALHDFQLLDFRHDSLHDSIVQLQMIPHHLVVDDVSYFSSSLEGGIGDLAASIHLVTVQYLSGKIGIYAIQNYQVFHLMHSVNCQERIHFETVESIFLSPNHLPLNSFQIPEKSPQPVEGDPTAAPTTTTATGKNTAVTAPVPAEIEVPVPPVEEVPPKPSVANLYQKELLKTTLLPKYTRSLKELGKSFQSLMIFSRLMGSNSLYLHSYRMEQPFLSLYSLQFNEKKLIMDTNYNIDYLDLSAIPMVAATGKLSKVKERIGLTSSQQTSIVSSSMVLDNTSPTNSVAMPYKTLKLTEERLLEHEKLYNKTSDHLDSASSLLGNRKNSLNFLQMELNNSYLPVDVVKADLWRNKKNRTANKGRLTKKLMTLSSLCAANNPSD